MRLSPAYSCTKLINVNCVGAAPHGAIVCYNVSGADMCRGLYSASKTSIRLRIGIEITGIPRNPWNSRGAGA